MVLRTFKAMGMTSLVCLGLVLVSRIEFKQYLERLMYICLISTFHTSSSNNLLQLYVMSFYAIISITRYHIYTFEMRRPNHMHNTTKQTITKYSPQTRNSV